MGIMFGAMIFSQVAAIAPDYSKAKIAASHIFHLIDYNPLIDSYASTGMLSVNAWVFISFTLVGFNSRKN